MQVTYVVKHKIICFLRVLIMQSAFLVRDPKKVEVLRFFQPHTRKVFTWFPIWLYAYYSNLLYDNQLHFLTTVSPFK